MARCASSQGPVAADAMQHTLLPKSKGDEYVGVVLEDRLNSYNPALEPGIIGTNSVENGMLMRKDLHALFGRGECAFIKVHAVPFHRAL